MNIDLPLLRLLSAVCPLSKKPHGSDYWRNSVASAFLERNDWRLLLNTIMANVN
ncbi:unnamed protein product [Periconia digitata]|uniref:Uncharacterized protein n=1 Tax=Periconia digitata TaxID=1303443 RepID=A0A9W4UEM8_9PLEO|nr:unnamed protein product [Periconia digitata]